LVAEPFRILTLDGGGVRGIFTAAVLAEFEQRFGDRFLDAVDLIVGTSTGGIIALGLASGRSGSEMLAFYRQKGPEIFGSPRRLRRLWGPKYDRRNLDAVLREQFGEDLDLNALTKPVCITAHELVAGTTRVLKDDHAPGLHWGGDRKVWRVAAATSAAPTYFAPVQLDVEDSHIDGGIWANNPAMVGIIEAVHYMARSLDQIRLLSLGTTSRPLCIDSHAIASRMGWLGWASRSLDLLQGSVSMASHEQARLLLGDERYLRIDDELPRRIQMDDTNAALSLQERGQQAARRANASVKRLYGL
jgi:patatin-like phospholipase/acyl hydrolase